MDIRLKLDKEQFDAAARHILAEVMAGADAVRGIHGGLSGLINAAPRVVSAVEVVASELGLISEDKKALAVHVICAIVPDSWVPDSLVAPIAGLAVEFAAYQLKRKGVIK